MLIVENAENEKIVINSKPAVFEEMWISVRFPKTAGLLFLKIGPQIPLHLMVLGRQQLFFMEM